MRRFFIIFGLLCMVSITAQSSAARAGIMDFLFPSLKEEEYDPTKEMVAPFAAGSGVEDKGKLDKLPVNSVSLKNPHRLSAEIGNWVTDTAGEAMNFDAGTAENSLGSKTNLFDRVGTQQYLTFLRDNNILNVMEDGRYNIRSYVNQQPLLLNEGLVGERYRWLFRVSIVMTYMDKNMKTYKGNEPELIQQATVNVQLGRIQSPDKPDGLQIEQWSGKVEEFVPPKESRK